MDPEGKGQVPPWGGDSKPISNTPSSLERPGRQRPGKERRLPI